jgi:hypothetical protein
MRGELVCDSTESHEKQPNNKQSESNVLPCRVQSLAEYKIRSQCFENRGNAIPYTIHVNNITDPETSYQEKNDTRVPEKTLGEIVPSTKPSVILELEISEYFCDARHRNIKCAHTYKRMMKLNLGKPDGARESFFALNVKSMMLILPAIFMGHYLDEFVEKMGKDPKKSVILQTFLNICVIYILHKVSKAYTSEFQVSLAGLFFSALFFGMQTNYIRDLKSLLPQL